MTMDLSDGNTHQVTVHHNSAISGNFTVLAASFIPTAGTSSNTGVILGVLAGGAAGMALIVIAVVVLVRRTRRRRRQNGPPMHIDPLTNYINKGILAEPLLQAMEN